MTSRKQVQKEYSDERRDELEAEPEQITPAKANHEITDELLDEIDAALGENLEAAQEFIHGFQQKGGQ
jgi:ubiquitin-like protein Pup